MTILGGGRNKMKIDINKNDYIAVNDISIEIKCGDDVFEFGSLQAMINAFQPGVIRVCRNKRKLAEMGFDTSEKSLFWGRVYDKDDDGTENFIIVARNYTEAELLFNIFLDETYYDIEYDGVYDIENYYSNDKDELYELYEEYLENDIGVYNWSW